MQTPKTAREIASRYDDVVRILSAQPFSRRDATTAGFTGPDDLASEALALAMRYEALGMASRFDPSRSEWTTYIVMVARSLVRDRLVSALRRRAVLSAIATASRRAAMAHGRPRLHEEPASA